MKADKEKNPVCRASLDGITFQHLLIDGVLSTLYRILPILLDRQ